MRAIILILKFSVAQYGRTIIRIILIQKRDRKKIEKGQKRDRKEIEKGWKRDRKEIEKGQKRDRKQIEKGQKRDRKKIEKGQKRDRKEIEKSGIFYFKGGVGLEITSITLFNLNRVFHNSTTTFIFAVLNYSFLINVNFIRKIIDFFLFIEQRPNMYGYLFIYLSIY